MQRALHDLEVPELVSHAPPKDDGKKKKRAHFDPLQIQTLSGESLPPALPEGPLGALEAQQRPHFQVPERLRVLVRRLRDTIVPIFDDLERDLKAAEVSDLVSHAWPRARIDDGEKDPAEGVVGEWQELVVEPDMWEGEGEGVGREGGTGRKESLETGKRRLKRVGGGGGVEGGAVTDALARYPLLKIS